MDFDELYVIQLVKRLYDSLDDDNRAVFRDLAVAVYDETDPHGSEEPDVEWLVALLEEYDPVTKYVYEHEVLRKRDYTTEGIISSQEKEKEFKRGLMYWSRMTAQYCITVTDEATMKAYEDADVTLVRWNTKRDGDVCKTCKEREGKVYPIDAVPKKDHWGCRCWLTPVLDWEAEDLDL